MKFEDKPDYNSLKSLLFDVLLRDTPIPKNNIYTFDWFVDNEYIANIVSISFFINIPMNFNLLY